LAIGPKPWIEEWQPDDDAFWERRGKSVAHHNITFSIFAEFLAFCVWVLWSVTAASLNKAGFHFSTVLAAATAGFGGGNFASPSA